MQISNSTDNLFKKFACLDFFKSRPFDNIIKQFPFFNVLHHKKQMFCGFDDLDRGNRYLVELDYTGVTNYFKNMNLARHSFYIRNINYL